MGVDLGDIVPRETRKLADFQGRTIAVDAFNTIYQFLASLRQADGTPLKDPRGRVTSHLAGLLYRTAALADAGIRPVYVFDGKPHALKAETLQARRDRKVKAQREYEEAKAEGDMAKAFSKAQQTSRLTQEMVGQAKTLLDALGLPHVDAPQEGEAQAAHMAARDDVWAACSQDFDAILVGAPRLVRNVTSSGRRKLPGRSVWVDVEPELIEFEKVLDATGLTHAQIVDVGLLVGTDYNAGIKGVGPKRAIQLMKKHGTLEAALTHLKKEIEDLETLRGLFMKPAVTDAYDVRFRGLDEDAVVALLCDEFGFSRDRVLATFPRYQRLTESLKQRSLDAFF